MQIKDSSENVITGNSITSSANLLNAQIVGIDTSGSSSANEFTQNYISGFMGGLGVSDHGVVVSNRVTHCLHGIYVGSYNKVFANEVYDTDGYFGSKLGIRPNSGDGVTIGSNNTVYGNTFRDNGIGLTVTGSDNSVYGNNFINNTQQVNAEQSGHNLWDNGEKGNYWSDYLTRYPNAKEVGNSEREIHLMQLRRIIATIIPY
jgi:parallel beta-helix repeat protein